MIIIHSSCPLFYPGGEGGFAQVLSLLRGIGIVIPLAVILSGAMGMAGIWLAMQMTECIVLVIALAGLRRKGR